MAIKTIKSADVYVTESDLNRYRDEYNKAFMHFSGTPPTLEEFIRRKQAQPLAELWKEQLEKRR